MDLRKIIEWFTSEKVVFIDARKLARKFNLGTHAAGQLLRKLSQLGYVKAYRKRRGRFTIYKVNNNFE